jgi:hypothetical protein
VAKSKYQAEFESLGVADVQKRASASIWSEDKLREARNWLSKEESRIAHRLNTIQTIAAAAAIISAIAAFIAFSLLVNIFGP